MNLVIVSGNLGKDPEVRYLANGTAVCRFSVATTEKWTDAGGQRQERTEWHNIVAWAKQAEHCGQYLHKGSKVLVEGKLQTNKWEKDGEKHARTEIIARHVQFLSGGRRDSDGDSDDAGAQQPADDDDNVPF